MSEKKQSNKFKMIFSAVAMLLAFRFTNGLETMPKAIAIGVSLAIAAGLGQYIDQSQFKDDSKKEEED